MLETGKWLRCARSFQLFEPLAKFFGLAARTKEKPREKERYTFLPIVEFHGKLARVYPVDKGFSLTPGIFLSLLSDRVAGVFNFISNVSR